MTGAIKDPAHTGTSNGLSQAINRGPISKFLPKYANVYVTIQSHGLSASARTHYVTANGVRNGLQKYKITCYRSQLPLSTGPNNNPALPTFCSLPANLADKHGFSCRYGSHGTLLELHLKWDTGQGWGEGGGGLSRSNNLPPTPETLMST